MKRFCKLYPLFLTIALSGCAVSGNGESGAPVSSIQTDTGITDEVLNLSETVSTSSESRTAAIVTDENTDVVDNITGDLNSEFSSLDQTLILPEADRNNPGFSESVARSLAYSRLIYNDEVYVSMPFYDSLKGNSPSLGECLGNVYHEGVGFFIDSPSDKSEDEQPPVIDWEQEIYTVAGEDPSFRVAIRHAVIDPDSGDEIVNIVCYEKMGKREFVTGEDLYKDLLHVDESDSVLYASAASNENEGVNAAAAGNESGAASYEELSKESADELIALLFKGSFLLDLKKSEKMFSSFLTDDAAYYVEFVRDGGISTRIYIGEDKDTGIWYAVYYDDCYKIALKLGDNVQALDNNAVTSSDEQTVAEVTTNEAENNSADSSTQLYSNYYIDSNVIPGQIMVNEGLIAYDEMYSGGYPDYYYGRYFDDDFDVHVQKMVVLLNPDTEENRQKVAEETRNTELAFF